MLTCKRKNYSKCWFLHFTIVSTFYYITIVKKNSLKKFLVQICIKSILDYENRESKLFFMLVNSSHDIHKNLSDSKYLWNDKLGPKILR